MKGSKWILQQLQTFSKKDNQKVDRTVVELLYSEVTTDEQIYNELKTKKITIKDGFGRDIEIDLGAADDV